MKSVVLVAGVLCCAAVISAFPLYGHKQLPMMKGFGGVYCPTHGQVGRHHFGFGGDVHHSTFEPLGLVGYYGDYDNLNNFGDEQRGIIRPWGNNDDFNNGFNDDRFNNDRFNDRGFDNFDNGILGNDDHGIRHVGPVQRGAFPRGQVHIVDHPRFPGQSPVGAFPSGPVQRSQFPAPIDVRGGIIRDDLNNGPLDNFDNNGFNNDLGLIQGQISHKK